MRFLVTGSNGQLGYDVIRKLKKEGYEDICCVDKGKCDITNRDKVFEVIRSYNPDVIIHCAAYTAVDEAEDDKEKCFNVNENATKNITDISIEVNAKLIYISTDYVFDGEKQDAYCELDKTNPVSIYGSSKLAGEEYVKNNKKHFIVRVSWLFGINGKNFVKTIINLGKEKKTLNVVSDQIGCPTYTVDLTEKIFKFAFSDKFGTYHVSNNGNCSWAEFAEYILKSNNIDSKVNYIKTCDYNQNATRPKNSIFSKNKLEENGFEKMPDWKNAIDRFNNELREKKILVTGGAGFIGSNFLHFMVKKYPYYKFTCLDALTYAGNYNNIKELENYNNFKFVLGNITNVDFIDKLFLENNFDWVVNFAAESHVDRSIENPKIFLETNIIGTQVLMDASLKYNIKRFHQISTDEVYGDLPLNKPELLFTEDTSLHTSSPYSASKAAADLLVLAYNRTYNLKTTISRCSNNYGPFQFPEKLIPVVISKSIKNERVPIYGKGLNVRDWIHVYDHNTGVDKILHNGIVGEVYNLGGKSEKNNIELVSYILNYLGKSEKLISFVPDRKGHDLRYAIDSSKSEKELNWSRKYTFDEGISETIEWYLSNEKWLEDIKNRNYRTSYSKK